MYRMVQVVGGLDGASVVDVVSTRVGMSDFFLRLEALRRDPAFAAALAPPRPSAPVARGGEAEDTPSNTAPEGESEAAALYDHTFAKWSVAFQASAAQRSAVQYSTVSWSQQHGTPSPPPSVPLAP